MKRVIEKTDNGSATLFVPGLDGRYHSARGVRAGPQHTFINMELKTPVTPSPHTLEIGFGTRLNAWLTLEEAEGSGCNVYYTGLGLYSLKWQTVKQLGYTKKENDEQSASNSGRRAATDLLRAIHISSWEEGISFTLNFTLYEVQTDVDKRANERVRNGQQTINHAITQRSHSSLSSGIIYFDALAPEKQPEIRSQELLNRLYVLLNERGILTTYRAKGIIRRILQATGLIVERLPGPPGGKRETLRARKLEQNQPLILIQQS